MRYAPEQVRPDFAHYGAGLIVIRKAGARAMFGCVPVGTEISAELALATARKVWKTVVSATVTITPVPTLSGVSDRLSVVIRPVLA